MAERNADKLCSPHSSPSLSRTHGAKRTNCFRLLVYSNYSPTSAMHLGTKPSLFAPGSPGPPQALAPMNGSVALWSLITEPMQAVLHCPQTQE